MIGTHRTTITSKITPDYTLTKICYHDTKVVQFDNDIICLDTGGHFTATTKRRMNQASLQFNLNYHVYQKDYIWYCNYDNKIFCFSQNKLVLPRTH